MSRIMLKGKSLPNIFSDEGVATIFYLNSRSPTRSVKNMTLYETWSGKKPSFTHFQTFVFVLLMRVFQMKKRKKLDEKSVKCIFIVYCDETKAYRLYNTHTKIFLVSHDVLFVEIEEWLWHQGVQEESTRIVI